MNALAPINSQPSFSVTDIEKVANAIAKGGLFGSKDPYAVLTLCLLAQAEGQHPAVVFRDYHIISGKPAKKAEAMLRDFLSAGGKIEWHALTDELADATFSHPLGGTARISWDHARAVKAQIAGNAMYKKYPRQMLRSSVISEGVRTIYPGATSGLYVEEEVQAFTPASDAAEQTIEHQPEPPSAAPLPGKINGIMKIKEAVREMKGRGNEATELDTFNAIVGEYEEQCAILCDNQHEWWIGHDRDGNEFESIPAWINRRRAELAPDESADELIRAMKECDTRASLDNWLIANMDDIEKLDGAASRKFQLARDFHESSIHAADLIHN